MNSPEPCLNNDTVLQFAQKTPLPTHEHYPSFDCYNLYSHLCDYVDSYRTTYVTAYVTTYVTANVTVYVTVYVTA